MKENEQQFTDIVRRNRSTIYTVCYMFSKDNDEVADMFQEVLIRLWNGMESFDGRSNIKTWIYRGTEHLHHHRQTQETQP